MATSSHYDILKVAKDAPSEIIRAAYKLLTQKYSADRSQREVTSDLLDSINEAYAVLSNPAQRAEYDRWLSRQESQFQNGSAINVSKNQHSLNAEKISSDSAKEKNSKPSRWLLFTAIGLVALVALIWIVFYGKERNNNSMQSSEQVEVSNSIVKQPTSPENITDIQSVSIPAHDLVAMKQFIGKWKGDSTDSGLQQTLDISFKTENSIIFLLDAKAGQGIGGVYGIAEYQNGYAYFYNKEYNCNIVFSMKSDILHVTTSGCQAYHAKNVTFDGNYIKPSVAKIEPSAKTKPKSTQTQTQAQTNQVTNPEISPDAPPVEVATLPAKKTPKLYKFSATVEDSEGSITTIELIAKDKNAARAIIRDFRGNPKVIKIKELKK